jgi:hypothetical protein
MAKDGLFPLPHDVMDTQLSIIDLITFMFPSPGELDIPPSTSDCIEQIGNWDDSAEIPPFTVPENIFFGVNLSIDDEHIIQLNISVPLHSTEPGPSEPSPLSYSIRQPSWMSKAEVAELSSSMEEGDVFSAFEYIREEAPRFIKSAQVPSSDLTSSDRGGPLMRVWFYFPSLSTREKRDDLVNHAPGYQLTGFVLAGKPGVLCLEGTSLNVDAYMKFIKTHSWGDIPSHQKKVSERYREDSGDITRVFSGMEEITDSLGERRGERANRGDMQALEAWLKDKGLHEAFQKVIM